MLLFPEKFSYSHTALKLLNIVHHLFCQRVPSVVFSLLSFLLVTSVLSNLENRFYCFWNPSLPKIATCSVKFGKQACSSLHLSCTLQLGLMKVIPLFPLENTKEWRCVFLDKATSQELDQMTFFYSQLQSTEDQLCVLLYQVFSGPQIRILGLPRSADDWLYLSGT